MNFKQLIRDYFTFSRNERKGIVVLLILIFLLAVANKLIFYFETPAKIDKLLLDSASRELGKVNDSVYEKKTIRTLFFFNPNTIDSVALDSLSIPESVKSNLLKFRRKGGKLYSNTDFRKIFGVTDRVFNQIDPFLLIDNETTALHIGANILKKNASAPNLFFFDPNKATDSEFLRLGFSNKQITTIRKYLDKGGIFWDKTDFFKIRVITENQKRILSDWIVIENMKKTLSKEQLVTQIVPIEINSADTIRLKQLPGIGAVLSKRIVKYRDLLGGFYSVSQLREVYGLSEQTIRLMEDKVTVDANQIKKLDLNFADVSELSRHPYLKKKLAIQIVNFRTKHGAIRDLSILRDSMILNIDEYNRIKPYL